jgi:putative ABC transport system substrate-binding protein
MRRRDFITLLCGAAVVWPLDAVAQRPTGKIAQIGFLTRKSDASVGSQIDAFRQGLKTLDRLKEKTSAFSTAMQVVT